MSLQVPTYPSPYSTTALTNAYAWFSFQATDYAANTGRLVVNVHTDAASANAGLPPIDQVSIALGQTYDTGQVDSNGKAIMGQFPTLSQVLTDNATEFGTIRQYLYDKLKLMPQFANSTDVA